MAKTTRTRMPVADTAEVDRKKISELGKLSIDESVEPADHALSQMAPMRLLVHSDTGVGKTTLFSRCPGAVFLDVEEGARQYRVPRWKTPLDSLPALNDALDALAYGKHEFRAVVIETLDAVEELLKSDIERRLREVSGKDGPRTLAELNEDEYGAGYDLLREGWRALLKKLDVLRVRGMHVLLSAHTKIDSVPNLDGKDFKRYAPQITGKKVASLILGWCDYVLFLRTEVGFVQEERGRKTMAVTGERWMYCTSIATHVAKCRGETPWPDRLPLDEDLGWSTFEKTAALIAKHGSDLPGWIEKEAERSFAKIERNADKTVEQRREAAWQIVRGRLGRRDYAGAMSVVEQADRETRERSGNGAAADVVGAEAETTSSTPV